jgi:hypothetical protein
MNFAETHTATGSMHHVNIRAYVEDFMLQSVYNWLWDPLVIQVSDEIDLPYRIYVHRLLEEKVII